MKRNHSLLMVTTVLVVGIGLSLLVALYVLRPPAEASGPIETIPLTESGASTGSAVGTESISAAGTDAVTESEEAETEPVEVGTGAVTEPVEVAADEPILYQLSQADSLVSFALDEDLRGSRITVVGATNQVAGELLLNLSDLSQTQVGVIQINARTLETDNNNRNRTMQNEILDTGSYEFITFTPTAISGLPDSAVVGETLTFNIEGNLTIRDVTLPVVFTVQATVVSETQIAGTASAVIARSDYGLTIPSVPSVANVEDEIELTIEFVANAG